MIISVLKRLIAEHDRMAKNFEGNDWELLGWAIYIPRIGASAPGHFAHIIIYPQ